MSRRSSIRRGRYPAGVSLLLASVIFTSIYLSIQRSTPFAFMILHILLYLELKYNYEHIFVE